ncbi:EF-hand calcium-binding domain-containing protein 9 [Chytriomyces hyalinus]|nr:EF-hand calcium-binding domain-containing protein 9 [Chytriomyces hyalinus]
MRVKSSFLKRLHLDSTWGLLTARSALICLEVFQLLDWRGAGSLDDIQFLSFMTHATDLKEKQVYKVFDIFDLDRSGSVEFDEFYLLVSILVAIKVLVIEFCLARVMFTKPLLLPQQDNQGKQFMYQHWRTCFDILDEDGGRTISMKEFCTLGFLFNFSSRAIQNIYKEFDCAGNMELDYSEFRLFVLAAIEMQSRLDQELEPWPSRMYNYIQKRLQSYNVPFFRKTSDSNLKIAESSDLLNPSMPVAVAAFARRFSRAPSLTAPNSRASALNDDMDGTMVVLEMNEVNEEEEGEEEEEEEMNPF